MKRKILLVSVILVLLAIVVFIYKTDYIYKEKATTNKNSLAFAIYEISEDEESIICEVDDINEVMNQCGIELSNYVFDSSRTYCTNGGTISYNSTTERFTFSVISSSNCYIYFTTDNN